MILFLLLNGVSAAAAWGVWNRNDVELARLRGLMLTNITVKSGNTIAFF